uniref:F-actin-capping protein subunit beta n=1 Tax=Oryctolagus cuniculus TaxID=9986 RepID=A0A5F9DG71_RABIT
MPEVLFFVVECTLQHFVFYYAENGQSPDHWCPYANHLCPYWQLAGEFLLLSNDYVFQKQEVEANNAFDQYRDLYFEGGVSSVYLWDLGHGFAGVILIKKAGGGSKKIKGCWESIHVVEVQEKSSGRTAHYKLTSTVMLWLQTNKSGSGTMNLGGSLTRQMEKDETVSDCSPHIANIGRLVEDMENKIRSMLNEIYFGKTKDIVNGLRSVQTFADKSKQEALKNDLVIMY